MNNTLHQFKIRKVVIVKSILCVINTDNILVGVNSSPILVLTFLGVGGN